MNRSLKLSMLVALALGSSQLLALDLGQVQVKSALGQPLLAEIPLHPANPAELTGLTVKLASNEQFARAGIVGGRPQIPLHFSVANATGEHPVIRITSSVPVDDPYLDLLIEVDGEAGPSVREYAILLDPPGAQAPVAVATTPVAPSRAKPAKSAAAAPAPQRVTTAPAPAPAPSRVSDGSYGPVQSGQTLSGIARNLAPAGVDVQQMMLALQQANPDAFYRENINALKSGAVLRVPTSDEAQATTLAAAVAEVRRQNSDWRAGVPGKPAVVADAATRPSTSGSEDASATSREDRLALVPATTGGDTTGRGASQGDKAAASLRDELLRTQESVASLQQQSGDLKTRLKDLSDINSKNEHLLSLKDSEIAELQAKLAAARATAGAGPSVPAAASAVAEVSPEEAMAPAVGSTVGADEAPVGAATSMQAQSAPVAASSALLAPGSSEPTVASSALVPAAPAMAEASTVATAPVAVEPEDKVAPAPVPMVAQPWYMQTWAWAAGAAVVVLLIILAMLGRRRKPAAKSATSLADRFGAAPASDDNLLSDADDDADQEQLLDQLAEHPDDIYLHLELVTLYYSRRDVERFEAAAEAMHAHVTDPEQDEWQDVLHMGEDLAPEHPLFDHHPESVSETMGGQGFDIDDYENNRDAPTVVAPLPPSLPPASKKVSEYNFDFDLTHPGVTGPDLPPVDADDVSVVEPHAEPATWTDVDDDELPGTAHDPVEFSDDPVDTKLDLARAYLDMGDADGARAMLGEVIKEGSQTQRDTARKLLDGVS